MVKFGYTIIYVENVQDTAAFYKKAFGLILRFNHESNEYAELETGQTILAFASEELAKENFGREFQKNNAKNTPAGIEIALISENVEATYKRAISSGAIAIKPPLQKSWGQTVAFIRDLNGIIIEICSSVEV